MAKITAGNSLYLYRLLARELGMGKQVSMARVAEALETDGICPEDLGCADVRALCEALTDFMKVTAFKKGQVFATVMRNEELDRLLERADKPTAAEKAASKGKPWKHRKGAKAIKPVKPRHVEKRAPKPTVEAEEPATTADAAAEAEVKAVAEEGITIKASGEQQVKPAQVPESAEPQVEALLADALNEVLRETAGEKHVDAAAPGTGSPAPDGLPEAPAAPASNDAPEPAAAPESAMEAAPSVTPEPTPLPEAPHEPSIKLTITYDPDPEPADEPENEPPAAEQPGTEAPSAPQAAGQAEASVKAANVAGEPAPPVAATRQAAVASRPGRAHSDLPQDFYADVRCPDEQLSMLYQVLPADVDPMATLEEDFRLARSTHSLTGTRSNVTFPLRFQRADGSPVTVTLRRTARAQGGKHWTLAEVEADAPETVGLEGLSRRVEGAWRAFADDEVARSATSPEDELARYAVLGDWDRLLAGLAEVAESENWGHDLHVLKDYLTMRFHRAKAQHRIAVTDDGSSAAFDTGLLTAAGEPVCAILEPCNGDIIWELTGFSSNTGAHPATWPEPSSAAEVAAALLAANDEKLRRVAQRLVRSPRSMTVAYDAVADTTYLLVQDENGALALDVKDGTVGIVCRLSLADAYACARVISADQPAWLAAGLE